MMAVEEPGLKVLVEVQPEFEALGLEAEVELASPEQKLAVEVVEEWMEPGIVLPASIGKSYRPRRGTRPGICHCRAAQRN